MNNYTDPSNICCCTLGNAGFINQTTTPIPETTEDVYKYDYDGAMVYLVFIIIFYSFSVFALIRLQTRKRIDYDYDYDDDRNIFTPKTVLKRMKDDNVKREALESLRDPNIRNKLWSIYNVDKSDPVQQKKVERTTMQNIDKKLKEYGTNYDTKYRTITSGENNDRNNRPSIFRQLSKNEEPKRNYSLSTDAQPLKGRFNVESVNETRNQ